MEKIELRVLPTQNIAIIEESKIERKYNSKKVLYEITSVRCR